MPAQSHRRSLSSCLLAPVALAALAALAAPAGAAPRRAGTMSGADVVKRVQAYAISRGYRPGRLGRAVTGLSRSGLSTRATIRIGGREVQVAVHHQTGRLQPDSAAALIGALEAAHTPYVRAGRGARSRYADEVVSFRPGRGGGFNAGAWRPGGTGAPLGTPRAGQSDASIALDAVSLGRKGSITLRLATPIAKATRGAAVRVRENGLGGARVILNQTPGMVRAFDGTRWYRLGHAGYVRDGDLLMLDDAIDPIPDGAVITQVRITDAPDAPRTRPDPTDGAAAAAAGKLGFDLVDVRSEIVRPPRPAPR